MKTTGIIEFEKGDTVNFAVDLDYVEDETDVLQQARDYIWNHLQWRNQEDFHVTNMSEILDF